MCYLLKKIYISFLSLKLKKIYHEKFLFECNLREREIINTLCEDIATSILRGKTFPYNNNMFHVHNIHYSNNTSQTITFNLPRSLAFHLRTFYMYYIFFYNHSEHLTFKIILALFFFFFFFFSFKIII
jgi:hypothetical protein